MVKVPDSNGLSSVNLHSYWDEEEDVQGPSRGSKS
jgi:hypothetical protein